MGAQLALDWECVSWAIAYLADTICTYVDLQIKLFLSLFPALEGNRLWLKILSNLRGNKINLLFLHSAVCLLSKPSVWEEHYPALHALSFLSLLNRRKHLWNIYSAAGIIVYEWSAQKWGVNDHGCLLCATKALTLVTHFWQAGPHPNQRMCTTLCWNSTYYCEKNIETTASVEKKMKVDMEMMKSIWICRLA